MSATQDYLLCLKKNIVHWGRINKVVFFSHKQNNLNHLVLRALSEFLFHLFRRHVDLTPSLGHHHCYQY